MSRRAGQALVVVGIVVLAANLRPAAVSVGPVLDDVRAGLGMSSTQAGVLTSLPVVAFAGFGALAPRLARRLGPHRVTVIALTAVVVGLLGRSLVDGVPAFLALSLLALGGMATGNVVMPSLVKRHFPDRIGQLTAVYSTALAIGLTSASVLTVPVADAAGGSDGWRAGLGLWAVLAAVALVPWLALVGRDRGRRPDAEAPPIGFARMARTRLGWLMAGFFALQSLQAYSIFGWFPAVYRDAGFSAGTAGLLLGVVTGVSVPLSFVVPSLAGRMGDVRPLVWVLGLCYPVGYVGLAVAPRGGAVVWAVVVGVGTATFPLVLTLIGLRARTPEGTASLSAFTQAVGYLGGAVGPFAFGLLHDLTGGWTVSLLLLTALAAPLLACGLAAGRPRSIEDELAGLGPAGGA